MSTVVRAFRYAHDPEHIVIWWTRTVFDGCACAAGIAYWLTLKG